MQSFYLLIAIFSVVLCNSVRGSICQFYETHPECPTNCFTFVKPILNYTISMQDQLTDCRTLNQTHHNQLAKQLLLTKLSQQKLDECESGQKDLDNFYGNCKKNLSETQSSMQDMKHKLNELVELVKTQQESIKVTEEDLKYQRSLVQKYQGNRPVFKQIGSKYYHIENSERVTWLRALQICSAWGGHLISLQNEEEWINLKMQLVDGNNYWTDINDIESDGNYMSATSGEKAMFLRWYGLKQPDNKKYLSNKVENCIELRYLYRFEMNDVVCDNKRNFICESDSDSNKR